MVLASLLSVKGELPSRLEARTVCSRDWMSAWQEGDTMQERLARICGTHKKRSWAKTCGWQCSPERGWKYNTGHKCRRGQLTRAAGRMAWSWLPKQQTSGHSSTALLITQGSWDPGVSREHPPLEKSLIYLLIQNIPHSSKKCSQLGSLRWPW